MAVLHNIEGIIDNLFKSNSKERQFLARQLMFTHSPLSKVIETYLFDNEGNLQKLDKFPMMRQIYDSLPQRLLLKCSRKTLKSTLLSNTISMNMIRFNFYRMLYVGPNEKFTKYFSSNYLAARFASPAVKQILVKGLRKDDVFEKILDDTNSSVLLGYASDDATRMRGPATDHNVYDEVQDMLFDILPIVGETMSMSPYKREIFAGTPLTTDNTINTLWKTSNQLEWMMKCTGCNHWNSLTEDNEPLKMIQKIGLSCSKCGKLINSTDGFWVERNPAKPGETPDLYGFHLAQPILPHYNTNAKEWATIFKKITNENYSIGQKYNEVFGLAYDIGSKPITEADLAACCQLGPMDDILPKSQKKYIATTMGADWGVNMSTSRTAACQAGLREDGVVEVFFARIYNDYNYEDQIRDIASRVTALQSFVAADGGPDPNRAILLGELTDPERINIVRYEHGKFIQHQDIPNDAVSWKQYRWCLHRSDTMTFVLSLIKKRRILFPQWEQMSNILQDILNIYIEVKEGAIKQELFYRHPPNLPDDFMHALNFAVTQLFVIAGDVTLSGVSSSNTDSYLE